MESLSSDGDRANTHEDHMSKPSTNHPGKAPVRKDWWEPTSICDVSLDTPDGFLAFEKKATSSWVISTQKYFQSYKECGLELLERTAFLKYAYLLPRL